MSENTPQIGLANEFNPDSAGWVRLTPWGEYPKIRTVKDSRGGVRTERWMQILKPEDGLKLASQVNGLVGRLKRAFQSVPVYARHPDLGIVSPETGATTDTPVPVGGLNRLEVRDDGLYGQIGLFDAGRVAVENEGLKWLSPFWWVQPIDAPAGAPNGTQYGRPVGIISVGLTDNPNIPGGEALANQGPPQGVTHPAGTGAESHRHRQSKSESEMKSLLIGLLVGQGIALANDASDDVVLKSANDYIGRLRTDLTALGNEKASLTTRVAALETELNAEKAAHATAKTALEASKTSLANERAIAAPQIVDLAIHQGRVPVAERDARIAKLKGASDLQGEVTALSNEAVRYPVGGGAASGDRRADGDRRANATPGTPDEAERQLLALANEAVKSGQAPDYQSAWLATKSSHPQLHETLAKKS